MSIPSKDLNNNSVNEANAANKGANPTDPLLKEIQGGLGEVKTGSVDGIDNQLAYSDLPPLGPRPPVFETEIPLSTNTKVFLEKIKGSIDTEIYTSERNRKESILELIENTKKMTPEELLRQTPSSIDSNKVDGVITDFEDPLFGNIV